MQKYERTSSFPLNTEDPLNTIQISSQNYFKNSWNGKITKIFFLLMILIVLNYSAESALTGNIDFTGTDKHQYSVQYIEMNSNLTKIFSADQRGILRIWKKDSSSNFIFSQSIDLGPGLSSRNQIQIWKDGQGIISTLIYQTIEFFQYSYTNDNYTRKDSKSFLIPSDLNIDGNLFNDHIYLFYMNKQYNQAFLHVATGNIYRFFYDDSQWKNQLYLPNNRAIRQMKMVDNQNTLMFDLYDKICIQKRINSIFTYNNSNCYSMGINLAGTSRLQQLKLSKNGKYLTIYMNDPPGLTYYKNYEINTQSNQLEQFPLNLLPDLCQPVDSVTDNKVVSVISNQYGTSSYQLIRYIYRTNSPFHEQIDRIDMTGVAQVLFASQTSEFLVYGNRDGKLFAVNGTKPPVACPSWCGACTVSNVCDSCPILNRDQSTNCSSCLSGFYSDSSACSPCNSKCQTCQNSNDCLTCKDPNTTLANGCVAIANNSGSCSSQNQSDITVTRTTQQCVDKSLISSIPNCEGFFANGTTFSCIKCKADSLWRKNVLRDNKLSTECVLLTVIQQSGSRCRAYQASGQTHTCSSCQNYYSLIPVQHNGISYNTCIHWKVVILTSNCQRYAWNAQLGRMVCQSCSNANNSLVPLLSGKSTPLRCILTSLISSIPNCFSYRYWNGRFYCLACNVGYAFDIAKNCNECAVGYTKSTPSGNTVCTMT